MYNFHFYFLISTRPLISVSVLVIVDIDLISLLLIFSFVQGMKLRRFYFFIVVEFSFAAWYHHEFPGVTCALDMNMYYKFVIPSCLLCP